MATLEKTDPAMTQTPRAAAVPSSRAQAVQRALSPILDYEAGSLWARRKASEVACDFVFGRPQEMALPGFIDAIRSASVPERPDWFGYKYSEEAPRLAVVASLQSRLGMAFNPDDILLTNGAWGALAVILQTLLDPGDEVIYVSPSWFYYDAMIIGAGGTGVPARCNEVSFDLDIDAVANAITARTRAVVINSPNNPTGRIYPETTLRQLANLLDTASASFDRRIYLISDEAYQRIVFPGVRFTSPTKYYSNSFLVYSYGKTLLAPGQRLGYIALAPGMFNAEGIRSALFCTQNAGGQGWPDAIMQYALPDIEELCIDLECLRDRRDLLIETLRGQGYSVHAPEGTFYLLPRSPIPDDVAFAEVLAGHDVFVLPGRTMQMPGYFRMALTANDQMVERSLKLFGTARAAVT